MLTVLWLVLAVNVTYIFKVLKTLIGTQANF